MQGKIVKGIAGFYYVHVPENGIFECKAKGIFRKDNTKPLVGDDVCLEVLDVAAKLGNINEILNRKNTLLRPAVANVDQAMLIFSIVRPKPNFQLLDRFMIMMKMQDIPCIILFTKTDLSTDNDISALQDIYKDCDCTILSISAVLGEGVDQVQKLLEGKTTVVAGPSGVGKSTLINCLQAGTYMETGAISEKIERGKHTTRHSQLITINSETYIMDTPGFTSLNPPELKKEDLGYYFPEFLEYSRFCRFQGCAHIHEPDCGVKEALNLGKINGYRYESYCNLYKELSEKRRY